MHQPYRLNRLLLLHQKQNNIVTAEHKPTLSNTTTSPETSLERNYIDLTIDESPPSSQGSFKSAEHSVSMTNNSKFNKKAWAPIDSRRGPLRSSQESSPSPRRITPQFNKVVPISRPATSMPRYDWLSENDVKPYSSNYVPYNSTSTNAFEKRPRVLPYAIKRPLEDENSVSFYSNKRRQPPTGISTDLWSRTNDVRKRRTTKEAPLAPPMSSYSAPATYRPTLSAEQQRVLDMVLKDKKSLFFTGSAGTGKSVLLRAIIDEMETIYGPMLAVTASTGIAATNINGCTLHSFGGIGIGEDKIETLVEKIKYENKKAYDRWTKTQVLIIDEISMVDAVLFDKLEAIARGLRNSQEPFGGIQIIVSGDFFQLPPVNPNGPTKFAFEANSWKTVITQTVMLTQVFRQKDGTFVNILNEMRLGRLSQSAIDIFKSLARKPAGNDEIEPTELYPLRREVELSNKLRLDALGGDVIEFKAVDKGDQRKVSQCMAPDVIQLKLHAQVMLLKNFDIDLVNGSLGVVIGFVGRGNYRSEKSVQFLRTPQRQKETYLEAGGRIDMKTPYPVVRFASGRELVLEYETWSFELPGGKVLASRSQIPLMLAWAISIHKSQGQTLDRVKVDLGKVFEKGQAYVALSRATSLDRLQILNFDPAKVMAHPRVTEFYKTLQTVN
ncbi:hypothetical protein G6F35_007101 [Rhizopus arrhizus]|nr:hypothetical protein G6F23_004614 [Rhizopus arrhizus]KAG1219901.1 hypothetical protein G6F35_007101 [Rhizopus arrhizus]